MPALCPLCVLDEYTSESRTDDGIRFAVCTNSEHGSDPFVWEVGEPGRRGRRGGEGIGADLGIWDKLLTCVVPGEPPVAYGVVEDRFFDPYPDEAAVLLARYGHRWRDPDHRSDRFSMSSYLATRLSELSDEGHLKKTWGPAEGPWAYNGTISWWQQAGESEQIEPPVDTSRSRSTEPVSTRSKEGNVARLAAAASLPAAEGDYTEDDFVVNLMATVLDYQMQTTVVERSIEHYKQHLWDEIRTLSDLEERLGWHPDTEAGNTALARALWGTRHWTRAHQLRDLAAFFRSVGVVDQESLRVWARDATFDRDFRGRVKGLGPAVFQWLVMRQGVDTVKPDVHVRRFAEGVLGRSLGDAELVKLVSETAQHLGVPARELDWRIWEASRAGLLE